jgi:hypothetical protein
MSFSYTDPASVEFGVCRGPFNNGESVLVPVDAGVQGVLVEMANNTRDAMGLRDAGTRLERYEPSQDHGAESQLALPLRSALAAALREFYGEENRPVDGAVMREPQAITAYYCIIHDRENNKLVAIRRASQFKAVLEAHLIQFIDDTLQAVADYSGPQNSDQAIS